MSALFFSEGEPGEDLSMSGWSRVLKSPAIIVGKFKFTQKYMLSKSFYYGFLLPAHKHLLNERLGVVWICGYDAAFGVFLGCG